MSTTVAEFAWSYSALKNFETCPKRYFHYNVLKDVVEPESDELRDGNTLHKHFENRLVRQTPLPLGYGQYEAILGKLVAAPGTLHGEQKLAITSQFTPCAYFGKGAWFRTQVDLAIINGSVATIIDWKTGKVKEDETQLRLMTSAVFIHQPKVQRVRAALVFVAYEQTVRAEFVREDLPEIWGEVLPRVRALAQARATQEYPHKPGGLCRKWCAVVSCPYHGK